MTNHLRDQPTIKEILKRLSDLEDRVKELESRRQVDAFGIPFDTRTNWP